jgi:hypothetical protein
MLIIIREEGNFRNMGACHSEKEVQQYRSKRMRKNSRSSDIKSKAVSESEIKSALAECFDRFDKNHDGILDIFDVMELVKYSQNRHNHSHSQNSQS